MQYQMKRKKVEREKSVIQFKYQMRRKRVERRSRSSDSKTVFFLKCQLVSIWFVALAHQDYFPGTDRAHFQMPDEQIIPCHSEVHP